jgi:integrase
MGKRLTALDVTRLGVGFHADGDGLYLQVTSAGARSWIYRYTLNRRTRDLGLGPAKAIPLKLARELAAEARRLRAMGLDPIEHRRQARGAVRLEQAKVTTFRQCAESYIAAHEAGWRNAKHRQQWHDTLAAFVHPIVGALPVQAVDTSLVLKVLEPIWTEKPETAGRVRGRVESILDFAKARGFRDGENPARWRGHLDHLLPAKSKIAKVEHLAALDYREVGAFMADLRQHQGVALRALEFAALTAARSGEVLGALWDEIDLQAAVWTVPPERMKAQREHRVPLSPRTVEILRERQTRREGDHVFPGARNGARLSATSLLRVLHTMNRAVTVHGFRSCFRDWCAEQTNYREVAEMALAHAVGDMVEAAYRRGDLFDKRRKLMDAWAEFCGKSAPASGKIVSMNRVPA